MAKKKPKRTPTKKTPAKKASPKSQKKRSTKRSPKPAPPIKDLIPDSILQKYGLYVMLGLILLVMLFTFSSFIFQENIYFFKDIGSDSYNVFLPKYYHNAHYFHEHGLPTWSFYQGMGQKAFPAGINRPFNFLMYLTGPNNVVSSVFWMQLLKLFLGGFFLFQFVRIFDFHRLAAVFGGVIFTFVGYAVLGSTGWYGHVENVLYGIFLLFAFEAFYQKKQWWFFPIAIFLISSNPVRLYLSGLFLFLYTLLRFLSDEKNTREILMLYVKLAGLGVIGVGINAVFSINTLDSMINSPRVSGGFDKGDTLSQQSVFGLAIPLERATAAFRLFSNDLLGNGSNFRGYRNYLEAPTFYCGLFTLLLIPQLFQFLNKRRKIIHGVFLGLLILPVLFPYFRYAMFLFIGDYYKHGLSLFLPMFLIVYAVWALNYIITQKKINLPILLGTLSLLGILLYYPHESVGNAARPIDNNLRNIVFTFLIIYSLGLLAFKYIKQKQLALLALLAVVVIEAGYMTSKTVNTRAAITKAEYQAKNGYNDYAKDAADHLRLHR